MRPRFEFNSRVRACATGLAVGLGLLVGIGCGDDSDQPKAIVFAAASTIDAMEEIIQQFEMREQAEIQTSFGSSSTLATQILNGAPADLFLSASLDWVDKLRSQKLVREFRHAPGNQLVVIAASGGGLDRHVKRLEDLLEDPVRRIAIADPDSVPAGIYAKRALSSLEIWDRLKSKCVYGVHVRQSLAQVESGVADVGLVYRTDAKISKSVQVIFEIPLELCGPIEYGLVLTVKGAANPEAKKLFEFFDSETARKIFREHGFVVPEDAK